MKTIFYKIFFTMFIALMLLTYAVHAQTLQSNLWTTNGTVEAAVVSGNIIYIGGQFNYVGPTTGAGGALSVVTGMPDTAFPKVIRSTGSAQILAVVPDGSGGWYIGGYFSSVGGTARNNIAHIRSDKTVDPTWNPNADNAVYALAVSGSTVYAGGNFLNIGTQSRYRIAALDASTGNATSWNPSPNNVVNALAVSGSTIYAGGQFTTIGDSSRKYIAALDASTGKATIWNPNMVGSSGVVNALVISGSTIYAGGIFTGVGGQARNNIAAIFTSSTGSVTGWNPNANNTVWTIAVAGSEVYAGGSFLTIGGQTRWHIAAIDTSTGNASSWNPKADSASIVYSLVVSGSEIYSGGSFTHIGGQPRDYIAEIDTSTGNATSWNPNASYTVFALAVSDTTVYVGGQFTSIGGKTRNGIAALDVSTGNATSWNPNSNMNGDGSGNYGEIKAIAFSGSTVFVGGMFENIGGQTRWGGIAALDASTGNATSWNPNNTKIADSTNAVYALAVSGSKVYAGGSFIDIGGQTRWDIVALDASTGSITNWNPNANNVVYALAVYGSKVYAGGSFTSIGDSTRKCIAALDSSTGNATSWNPNTTGSSVSALAFSGSTVYVGGTFTSMGGQTRQDIASLDTSTGNATSWNPNAGGPVNALAVSGSTVYAGGQFNSIGGQMRYGRIAALDASTNTNNATSWNPNNTGGTVSTLALDFANNTVYFGGSFTTIVNTLCTDFAGVTNSSDLSLPVELVSFNAMVGKDNVELKWQTATEVNNYGFEIQRSLVNGHSSSDNGQWEKIGFVKGSGNSNSPMSYSYVDDNSISGSVEYRLKQIDNNGNFKYSSVVTVNSLPTKFELSQNYPNPFNPTTTINYELPQESKVVLKVYDILGQEVATLVNKQEQSGVYTVQFSPDSFRLASGVYIYRLTAGSFVQSRKMTLLK